MNAPATFLPPNLRPDPPRVVRPVRRSRRTAIRLAAVLVGAAMMAVLLARWRVSTVDVHTCPGLPAPAVADLESLTGRWIPSLDLDRIRRDTERWPGVASVVVELTLPDTLRVEAVGDELCASIAIGRSWHGVDCSGRLSRMLPGRLPPVLEGFEASPVQLRSALRAATRFARDGGVRVLAVRRITQADYELTLAAGAADGNPVVVRVLPEGNDSEAWWHAALSGGEVPQWADLRSVDRVVVRRAG